MSSENPQKIQQNNGEESHDEILDRIADGVRGPAQNREQEAANDDGETETIKKVKGIAAEVEERLKKHF